ncbi:S1 family peptidase [Thiorhodovibrio frisius]|uniref:S1 family peptidase n=1 Tax=Thiorhodovibrio frisius TaxID=631362 RepID=UPI00022C6E43|nr:hypothetical protein Thiofri_02373 [Thiorhodovibrio frisius]
MAGADLREVSGLADIALLRLHRPAPSDAAFANRRIDLPPVGSEVAALHYPGGKPQAFCDGRIAEHIQCDWLGICPENQALGELPHFLTAFWRQGSTEDGSSGSGLFDAKGQLIGILHGGASHAPGWSGPDDYGWIGLAFGSARRYPMSTILAGQRQLSWPVNVVVL